MIAPSKKRTVIALANFLILLAFSLSHAQTPTPITSSGLNTQVSGPLEVGGNTQFNITGGTRPEGGANLFHSFGDFGVPTDNIANFLNSGSVDLAGNPLAAGLPTSNVLGRVTGGDPSVIFGTIQTNGTGGFGNASLFLMNPDGFLFGPNATVNVGGMVAFTTADYLQLEGSGRNGIFYADTARTSVLSSVPVAAFGFLGSNSAAIAVQGSTLKVAPGQSISLVGGNRGFDYTYTDPDTGNHASASVPGGVTMTGGKLSAPGGQINLASVASAGEIHLADLESAPNINGQSFTTMGNITLSQAATLDVSGNAAGTVRIRGGQFEFLNSSVNADTGGANGAETAIDVRVTGDLSISSSTVSAFTARALGPGNAGEIRLDSAKMDVDFAFPEFGVVIDSSTVGSGNAGKVTVTTGDLTATNNNTTEFVNVFIDSGTGGGGNGGDVTIKVRNGDFLGASVNTGDAFFFGTGSAGDLYIGGTDGKAESLNFEADLSAEAFSAKGGSITLEGRDIFIKNNKSVSSISLLGENPITIEADRLVMDNVVRVQAQTQGMGNGGDIIFRGNILEMTNESTFTTQTFGDGDAGAIRLFASDHILMADDPQRTTPSGLFTNSFGNQGLGMKGDAGSIEVTTMRLDMNGGARFSTTTQSGGNGGDMTVTAPQGIFISGQRIDGPPLENFGLGGSDGSGIYTRSIGTEFCGGPCGKAGDQILNTGSLVLDSGGTLDSGTTSNGAGGTIQVNATNQVMISGTLADGSQGGVFSRTIGATPDSGDGGNINLTAGQSVTISDGASVSAGSTGPGNAGDIVINAGQTFTATNSHDAVTTQAEAASGGNIVLIATDTVHLTDSRISASVADGSGGGGNISIDPQAVILQNSQILAQAAQGQGGAITITTNLFLPDATSRVNADSGSGVNGTVTIQSPNSPASGKIQPLRNQPLEATSLLNQRCAALAGGEFSSFTVAGRDSLPTEPDSWLASPLFAFGAGEALGVRGEGVTLRASTPDENTLLSLRQVAPSGFLTQAFAVDWSADCQS